MMEQPLDYSLQEEAMSDRAVLKNKPLSAASLRGEKVGGTVQRNRTKLTRFNMNLHKALLERKVKRGRRSVKPQDDSEGFEVLLVPTKSSPRIKKGRNPQEDSIDAWKSQLKTLHGIIISDVLAQVHNAKNESTTMIALTTDTKQKDDKHRRAVIIKGNTFRENLTDDDTSTTLSTMATRITHSDDRESEQIMPKKTGVKNSRSKLWSRERRELWMTASHDSIEKSNSIMEMVFFDTRKEETMVFFDTGKEETFYMEALPRVRTVNW